LRFYVPRKNSVTIPANTPLNSELYPGAVPDDHVAGVFLFDDGPYLEDYSFYLASQIELNQLFLPKTAK
jgi:hypothetical protein